MEENGGRRRGEREREGEGEDFLAAQRSYHPRLRAVSPAQATVALAL